MMTSSLGLILTLACLMLVTGGVGGRQMCNSCQYLINGRGKECTSDPDRWTEGQVHIRCPGSCVITADFDANTNEPTYFFRGCVENSHPSEPTGCHASPQYPGRHHCYYFCVGENYCNNRSIPTFPGFSDTNIAVHSAPVLDHMTKLVLVLLVASVIVNCICQTFVPI